MGVRLYTPTTGRFLTADPIHGGNASAYGYPVNPIGDLDVNGMCPACVLAVPVAAANIWNPVGWVLLGAIVVGGAVAAIAYAKARADGSADPDAAKRYNNRSGLTRTHCRTWKECKALAKTFVEKYRSQGFEVTTNSKPRFDPRYGNRKHIVVTVYRNGKRIAARHFILLGKS